MADQSDLAGDLLRGAQQIAQEIYGKGDRQAQRRLYHEQDRWPIFQLDDSGVFYALRSRLRAHVEAKSAAAEARMAAAAQAAATKTSTRPKPRRRRRARPTNEAA